MVRIFFFGPQNIREMTEQSYRITVSGDGQLEMSRPKNECGEKSGVHIDVAIEAIGKLDEIHEDSFNYLILLTCRNGSLSHAPAGRLRSQSPGTGNGSD